MIRGSCFCFGWFSGVAEMDGRDVDGNKIQVEHAKGPRPGGPARGGGPRSDFRVRVEGISRETSWQDLKVKADPDWWLGNRAWEAEEACGRA